MVEMRFVELPALKSACVWLHASVLLFDELSARLLTAAADCEYVDDMRAVVGHSSGHFVCCYCGQKAI